MIAIKIVEIITTFTEETTLSRDGQTTFFNSALLSRKNCTTFDIIPPNDLKKTGPAGLEPATGGFGDRCSTN